MVYDLGSTYLNTFGGLNFGVWSDAKFCGATSICKVASIKFRIFNFGGRNISSTNDNGILGKPLLLLTKAILPLK